MPHELVHHVLNSKNRPIITVKNELIRGVVGSFFTVYYIFEKKHFNLVRKVIAQYSYDHKGGDGIHTLVFS